MEHHFHKVVISKTIYQFTLDIKRTFIKHGKSLSSSYKSHECDTFGHLFKRKDNLSRHMQVHTGYKPFSCELCGKSFTQNNILTTHMLIHTGDNHHSCEICGKSFTSKHSLESIYLFILEKNLIIVTRVENLLG